MRPSGPKPQISVLHLPGPTRRHAYNRWRLRTTLGSRRTTRRSVHLITGWEAAARQYQRDAAALTRRNR